MPISAKPAPPATPANPVYDPIALARSLASAAEKGAKLMGDFAARQAASGKSMLADELGLGMAFMELAAKMLANPYRLAEAQLNLWWDYTRLWQSSLLKAMGVSGEPVAVPAKTDKRFGHEDWEAHFLFDYVKQSYLIASRWLNNTVASVEGLDAVTRKKVDFFTRQYADALAPTNFALTNPEVFRETIATGGQNLVKGLHNLLDDIERGNGRLRVSMTDSKAFELGVNIATTPGKVVFQTDLSQLLQFEPTTREVYQRPLLILPPWINKYYILDLRESNSLVKWCVDHGMTVFLLSWVNPDEKLAHKDFVDYLHEGPLTALDKIEEATGEREVSALGYCLGGTLLAATLGYLAGKDDQRIASASFMASLIDFEHAGEIKVFIDEGQVATLEKKMNERGFLEASEMATTFNMLRANDLIWSFVINNYLLGRDPFPFDLLHWNQDSTRMPAAMHTFYLRNMYLQNKLCAPGGIVLDGVPIDLGKVTVPAYFASALEDHIAPWKATYAGAKLLRGKSRFVLSGSGHVAGMINPPPANKYGHWTRDELPADPDEWLAGATHAEGSWWPDWFDWLQPGLGTQVPARVPGTGRLRALEAAPGSYAKVEA